MQLKPNLGSRKRPIHNLLGPRNSISIVCLMSNQARIARETERGIRIEELMKDLEGRTLLSAGKKHLSCYKNAIID